MHPALLIFALAFSALTQAQEIRFTQQQLQQALSQQMPITQEHELYHITLSDPVITLSAAEQRVEVRCALYVSTAFGLSSRGKLAVSSKIRYERNDFSFYLDDPRISELRLETMPALEGALRDIAQSYLAPALSGKPIYTLSDQNKQEALARAILQSLVIEQHAVVAHIDTTPNTVQ